MNVGCPVPWAAAGKRGRPTPHLAGTGWRTGWAPAPLLGGAPDPVILRGRGERLGFPVAARPNNGRDWTRDTWVRCFFLGCLRHWNYSRSAGVGSRESVCSALVSGRFSGSPGQDKAKSCRRTMPGKDVSETARWFLPWHPEARQQHSCAPTDLKKIKHDPHALPARHVLAETPIDADAGAPPTSIHIQRRAGILFLLVSMTSPPLGMT